MQPETAVNDGNLFVRMKPPVSPEQMVENMRSSLSRGLREIMFCHPHGRRLSIASGGPSLQDTHWQLDGDVAAVNGSLGFLLDNGVVPYFCGVCDASEHMADIVAADPRVRYLIASHVHPSLLDKLLDADCRVWLWHSSPRSLGTMDAETLLKAERPSTWLQIFGGCTIGLRMINIGHVLGYRDIALHGMDSSFRGDMSHAYGDRRNGEWASNAGLEINGYRTSLNFLQQVSDFANTLERFSKPDVDPVKFTVYGDGLLQATYAYWLDHAAEMGPVEAFQRFDASAAA